jgi:NADH:ubiquinone oxidoreductase subunit E
MCFTPKGALMMDLVGDYSTQIVNDLGLNVYSVKGTNMFSLDEPPVREHAALFGDRLYMIPGEKRDFVMRYAACHQQFAMMKNWNISYKQLAFGAFEVADAYRLEQSGETMLCFRTRRMNMPDLHVVCKDIKQSEEWFEVLDGRIYEEAHKLGRDYEMLVNFSSKEAYRQHKDMMMSILQEHNQPALLHFYPEGINYYWTVNIEYHILDDMKRAREIGTVQIDIGNAKRFGITYTDDKGQKQYPIILHTAVIGTLERYIYTILDTAVQMESQGKVGYLPRAAMTEIADYLDIPAIDVYGVVTFYNQFRLNPPGKHSIKVCLGTACHMKGGYITLDAWKRRLNINPRQTTKDREFDLDTVACVGCCTMAPVTVVDGKPEGRVEPTRVDGILLAFGYEHKTKDKVKSESN